MTPRAEPRSMTLSDVMALSAGFALASRFRPIVGAYPYAMPSPGVMLTCALAWSCWLATAAVSAVAAARLVRYRRGPRPAEWLSILTTVAGVGLMGPHPDVDDVIRWAPYLAESGGSFAFWRWVVAGVGLAVVAAGLKLVRSTRGFLPPWLRTAGLVIVADLFLSGPVLVCLLQGPDLLAPRAGFGPGTASMLYWLACQWVARIPLGLYFGIPAMASLLERVARRPWTWAEWAGLAGPLTVLVAVSPLWSGNVPGPSPGWAAERGIVGAWFVGVGMLARWVVLRAGPAWSRWFGGPTVSA